MLSKTKIVKGATALLLTALSVLLLVLAWSIPSALATSFGWAYLWADQPSAAAEYTPNGNYQFNSTGAANTVVHTGVGEYTARLPNLGAHVGTVHVTAYKGGAETCKVASWYPDGSTQQVNVRCFNSVGVPADSSFTMTFANPSSSAGPMAFLWADQPSATAEYTPNGNYQFNSTGAANTVVHTGIGEYTARLPNLGAHSGHVQVTAYGTGSERCKVASWYPDGSTQQVNVRCFSTAGSPVDTLFTLTYVSGTNIVGAPDSCHGTSSMYAWAQDPTSSSYSPHPAYYFGDICTTPGVRTTITRSGVGAYAVKPDLLPLGYGDVQVTAYGSGPEYCKVAYWTPSDGVQVRCFNSSGAPVDTQYDVTFLRSR